MYNMMDQGITSTAESVNSRLERTVPQTRFLSGCNFVLFLIARFALINVTTMFRRMYDTEDLEDEYILSFFMSEVPCNCTTCSETGRSLRMTRNNAVYGLGNDDHTVQEDSAYETNAQIQDIDQLGNES